MASLPSTSTSTDSTLSTSTDSTLSTTGDSANAATTTTNRTQAIEALRREGSARLKASLEALKRDVAVSIRLFSRDFSVLGRELVAALQQRERTAQHALEHERKRRRKLQHQVADTHRNLRVLCRVRPALLRDDADVSTSTASPPPPRTHHQQQLDASMHESDTNSSSSPPASTRMRVHVATPHELHVSSSSAATAASTTDSTSSSTSTIKRFTFARVLDEHATDDDMFQDVAPHVRAAAAGKRACVVAYGPPGAGKTHTMDSIYSRACELLFASLGASASASYTVTLQLVQIYNEEVVDLLRPSAVAAAADASSVVEIRHGARGVYLQHVTRVRVASARAAVACLQRGTARRTVGATAKHARSSRSHCVALLDVVRSTSASASPSPHKGRNSSSNAASPSRSIDSDATATRGRLVLVDLAGSERRMKALEDATNATKLRETQHINRSLSALSDVLAALDAKDRHVPFRNSKLTHVLQDALRGPLLLILHVCLRDVSETIDALKFAARVQGDEDSVVTAGAISCGSGSGRQRSSGDRTADASRLHAIIASQSNELQTLHEKLASERDLRRKYEKRLEEYRQDDVRRKARDDDAKRLMALAPLSTGQSNNNAAVLLSPDQQQHATRRWSLYTRAALKSANNARGLNGVENIADNILRSRVAALGVEKDAHDDATAAAVASGSAGSTPVRSKRRLSVYSNSSTDKTTGPTQLGKRPSASDVKSILKKRRVESDDRVGIDNNSTTTVKQVSFHLSPRTPSPTLLLSGNGNSGSGRPPPAQLFRSSSAAARVPAAAGRVRTAASSSSPVRRVVSTPMRVKSKANVGWR